MWGQNFKVSRIVWLIHFIKRYFFYFNIESNENGDYNNPFGNIVKALYYEEEQSSTNSGSVVNICEYMLILGYRSSERWSFYDKKLYTQQLSKVENKPVFLQLYVNIQPAFWNKTLGGHYFGASDSDSLISLLK